MILYKNKLFRNSTLLAFICLTTFCNCKGPEKTIGTPLQDTLAFAENHPSFPPPPMDFMSDSLHRPPMGPPLGGNQPPHGMPPHGMGMPPGGVPPEGMGMPPGEMGNNKTLAYKAILASSSDLTESNKTIQAHGQNESALLGKGTATIEVTNSLIITSGNTTSNEQSSFCGLNAAILAIDSCIINSKNNHITTTGEGANAIFSYGNSYIYSVNDSIDCTAGGGHGIMASGGGKIDAKNIYMVTRGRNSGAIATDRGSGTITVNGAKVLTTGPDSPGIYSTGKITVTDANIEASGAEVAVIEGSNSIITHNTHLLCSYNKKWGVMIYQSFSGDAEGVDGHFEMNNGSLYSRDSTGPLFFITNSNANIYLNQVDIENASGIFLDCKGSRWGNKGTNGGQANIYAKRQVICGEILADNISSVNLNLSDSSLFTGSINPNGQAKQVSIKLDNTSSIELTDNVYVNTIYLTITDNSIRNIKGNGFKIFYNPESNPWLKSGTYPLNNNGLLTPWTK